MSPVGSLDCLCIVQDQGKQVLSDLLKQVVKKRNNTIPFCHGCLSFKDEGSCVLRKELEAVAHDIKETNVQCSICQEPTKITDSDAICGQNEHRIHWVCRTGMFSGQVPVEKQMRGLQCPTCRGKHES